MIRLAKLAILGFGLRSYKESLFVAANFYLSIGITLGLFNQSEVSEDFADKSSYLFDQRIFLNPVFEDFVIVYLDIGIEELLPYIQYSASLYKDPVKSYSPWPCVSPLNLANIQKSKSKNVKGVIKPQRPGEGKEQKEIAGVLASLRQISHVHDPAIFAERPGLLEFSN